MRLSEGQLYSAVNEFIDREIMPIGANMDLPSQFLFGLKMGVVKRKIQSVVKQSIYGNNALKAFGIIDENGYIDIDTVYESASDTMSQMRQLDVMGITFKESDLQKLYGIMQKYANQ